MTDKQDLKTRIKEAIEACATGDLSERALHLLKTLGYHAPRLNYFTEHSYTEFEGNFASNTGRFSKKNALSEHWKSVDVLFQLTGDDLGAQHGIFRNEQVDNTIIQSYLFFALELKPRAKAYTRTELSQITREVNKCFAMPAMILFKHGLSLSFAVIDRRLHKRESSRDVLEKVTLIKDIRTTATNRAHIEILFDLSLEELRRKHGFTTFPALHEAWRKTLDTKELNRKFFRELSNWYFHAVETTEWPADAESDRDKRNAINVIRLITRLMFVWFLREKDLVPDELFDKEELGLGGDGRKGGRGGKGGKSPILKTDAKEPGIYYKAILQNLFFATLNTEMGKRRFLAAPDKSRSPHHFIHNVFRYEHCFTDAKKTLKELFDPIPFLNGGLFECLDKQVDVKGELKSVRIDGFSNNPKNPLHVPDKLFFDPEGEEHDFSAVYGTTRARKEKVRGLIDILGSYKFTITENTPIEEEVALDPELLGKVFENLLANYNPETRTTARKQTGSFYTPREIVNYMVDESLIAYLKCALTPGPSPKERGAEGHSSPSPSEKGLGDEGKLRHLLSYTEEPHQFSKQEAAALITAIDTCKILDPACGSGAFPMGVLHKLVHVLHKLDPRNTQWRDRQLATAKAIYEDDARNAAIERINSAFEHNELDYGRKLFLIENAIYGVDIQPIAMQIAKLRFFISLVVDQRVDRARPNCNIDPLPNLETKLVAANTLMKLPQAAQLNAFEVEALKEMQGELADVRHEHFKARTGATKEKWRKEDARLRAAMSTQLKELSFETETSKMLSTWDPYDQNKAAPFFDPVWMFGVKNGFNLVIGNPPYVRQESFKELKPDLGKRYPETFTSTADLFTYFIQAGHDMLAPHGVFCYIVSNKWMRAGYGAKLRAYLGKQQLLQLLDFGEQPVFEATAYTCVLLSRKAAPPKDHAVLTWSFTDLPLHDLPGFVRSHAHQQQQSAFVQADYRIGDAAAEALMAKLKRSGVPLGEYLMGGIYYGIKTGYNKAFVIDKATRDALIKADKRSQEVIKPFLVGKDVRRYGTPVPDKWLILLPFGITNKLLGPKVTDEAVAMRGMRKEYPAVMKHLEQFREECQARTDQGQFWWELRACDYYEEFEKPKIVTCSFAQQPTIMLDTNGVYSNNKTTLFGSSEKWLLAILNSHSSAYFISQLSSLKRGGWFDYEPTYSSRIPIRIPPQKVKAQLEQLVERRLRLTATDERQRKEAAQIEREIDQMVYGLYGLTAEEVAIVEGSVGAARGKGKGGKKKGAAEAAEE